MTQDLDQRRPGNPAQQLVLRVRDPLFKEQVGMALPPTVSVDRFVRVVTAALIANPDIAKLDHDSVLTAMVRAAADGLIPDGKEAAITPRGGKAVYVPMIAGFRKLAGEHGWTLRTAVVYAADQFEHAVVDGDEKINHVPVRPGAERGELIAAYAIAKHRDGRKMMAVLHPDDIARRRASASTDKVWETHTAAMWEKSAGRDLFEQLGLGELDERIQRVLSAAEADPNTAAKLIYGEVIDESAAALPPAEPGTAQTAEGDGYGFVADGATDGAGAQQAAAVESPPAAAAPEPRDPVTAPHTQESFLDEPEPEPESPFAAPANAGVDDDPAVFAARAASELVVPVGAWQGKTLAEVHAAGERGEQWFGYALGHFDDSTGTGKTADPKYRPGTFVQALRAYVRVFIPEVHQEATARKEAAA